jgi:NADPH2:quinone reductase
MRAIVIDEPGGPERLVLREVPDPVAAPGEVVIDVRAVGVNFADVLLRRGVYPGGGPPPWTPGLEVAGDLDGRAVLAIPGGKGYASRVVVDERFVFDIPPGRSYVEGAALLLTFLTAWMPLARRITPGSTLLVTAAAGGVGTAAIQVGRLLGARVIAAASGTERLEACRRLGAEVTIDYTREDLASAVKAVGGADVALDMVGGSTLVACIDALRPRGTAIAVGAPDGDWAPVSPALLVGRNAGLEGFFLGRLLRHAPADVRAAALRVISLWADGSLAPVISHVLELAAAPAAHLLLEERRAVGKVVLEA